MINTNLYISVCCFINFSAFVWVLSHGGQVPVESGLESPDLPGKEFSILKLFFSCYTCTCQS